MRSPGLHQDAPTHAAITAASTANEGQHSASDALNVVVTGGSTGIGEAIVRSFASAGHRVLFTYLSGLRRAEELHTEFKSATPVQLDQADVHSVALFASVAARWAGQRGIDVLVNNAALGSSTVQRYVDVSSQGGSGSIGHQTDRWASGSSNLTPVTPPSPPMPTTPALPVTGVASTVDDDGEDKMQCADSSGSAQEQKTEQREGGARGEEDCTATELPSVREMLERAGRDEALMKVNALGPLWVTHALTDVLHRAAYRTGQSRAMILFIGSVGGGSSAVFPEYCAADLMSKSALTYLSKHLAAKYVREPIDVMCLSPGATETAMFRKSTLSRVRDEARFIDSMPKRKLIQPDDIAQTVFWLATSSSAGIFHGAVLDASMGLAVRPGLQTETESYR